MQTFDQFTFEDAVAFLGAHVGAILIADQSADRYRTLVRRGMFQELLAEEGTYKDLVQKLWFHFNHSNKRITEEYQVFIPNLGKFSGTYSKRLNLIVREISYYVQMTIRPLENGLYLFVLDELDERESKDEQETQTKVANTIQNIYLFTMCFDLVKDTTSSMSLSEVSEENMNSEISYSAWRMMICDMFEGKDRDLFLERSDPVYLRRHFAPGQMESFDCRMRNLEGVFIWVKLIFSRMATTNEDDYRFVYIVQNIHESAVNLQEALKHYEELASFDALTKIFNRGRIETEIENALTEYRRSGTVLSMMVLDIDHFKLVNDLYGHAAGDTALKAFSQILREVLGDQNAAYGRWGGEEFTVILRGADRDQAALLAEKLRRRIEQEHFASVGSVTCSIGVSMIQPGDDLDSLFGRADAALYEAKQGGRNRVCVN